MNKRTSYFISNNHQVLCGINFLSYLWPEENELSLSGSRIKKKNLLRINLFYSLAGGHKPT